MSNSIAVMGARTCCRPQHDLHLTWLWQVYKLLEPHFRYTLRMNCSARKALICAGGLIESCFTPGRFSMELSARAYESWRFEDEGLEADLLKRCSEAHSPPRIHP